MDYKDWYVVTVGTNKENATKAQMLARRALFHDTHLQDVDFLRRKEIKVEKSGKRSVKHKMLIEIAQRQKAQYLELKSKVTP